MAIFVKGRTTCRICSLTISSADEMVGMPIFPLPSGLQELADSCLHRRCLDEHPRREELLLAWQQHWRAQAKVPGLKASVNPHGALIFRGARFMFAAMDTFVYLEEASGALNELATFFVAFNSRERASLVAAWNTYALEPRSGGVRLLVTQNPPAPGTLRATDDTLLLDYEFSAASWKSFVDAWADLDKSQCAVAGN